MLTSKTAPFLAKDSKKQLLRLFNIFIPSAIVLGVLAGVFVVILNKPAYILMGLVGIVVFLASLYSIEFGLIVLVFLVFTRFSDVIIEYHFLPSVAKPYMVLIFITILLRWVMFQNRPQGWFKPALMFGLLSLVGFVSLVYSPVPDRVLGRLVDDLKDAIIAIFIVILLQSNNAFRRTIWTLIFVAIFLGTLTVFQYATGTFDNAYGGFAVSQQHQIIGTIDDYRATGPIGDPNFFAQIMTVLVPISFERFLHEKRLRFRLLALWGMTVSVFAVILTYSRGGLFAMLAGVLVLLIFYPPKRIQVPIIILSIAIFISLLPPHYLDRFLTLGDIFSSGKSNTLRVEDRSLQGRASENLAGWEMIKDKPLFGIGLSSYSYLFPLYSKNQGIALVASQREAHNMFIEVAAETGIVGFFIFGILLLISFRSVINARRFFISNNFEDYAGMATGFLAGLSGYFVAAMFVHNAFPRYFYLLLGIALSLSYVNKNVNKNKLMIFSSEQD